ncbi:uncharacterized protein LOC129585455 isoform X1 [Paramacrobiotus metropolitanus]|uniref:uncharacterized protein LOC129585455 isoform X1 n=1 Tax=Paramacrobiotus metropolitanus TaxID=2943436 RepID=UPI0024457ED2|nr:uncharacterized protein LOC129585455 isoform X1 [Paramacrobiotus metropolitanus]
MAVRALPFLPDGESFHDSLYCEKCQCFLREPCWQHAVFVQDGDSIPLAIASLPDVLAFHNDGPQQNVCQSSEKTIRSVVARTIILPQTVFGPFIAPLCSLGEAHSRTYSSVDGQCVTFTVENDRWCNWMKLVRTADHGQHNLRAFIHEQKVLFVAVKVILPGEKLTLALPQIDRKDIHSSNDVNYVDVSVECVSSATDVNEDPDMVKCEENSDADESVDAMSISAALDVPAVCFSVDAQRLAEHGDPADLLPQSQYLPAPEQLLTGISGLLVQLPEDSMVKCEDHDDELDHVETIAAGHSLDARALVPDDEADPLPPSQPLVPAQSQKQQPASLPALRNGQREDSPEYPLPSNLFSPDSLLNRNPGKRKSDETEAATVASKFSRVYSLRMRSTVRAGAAYGDENLSDDNDKDFCLSENSDPSSIDSECCSENDLNLENTATKRQDRKRGTKEKQTPSSRGCRKKTENVILQSTAEVVLPTNDSSARKEPCRLPDPAFLEARNSQIKAVVAANPFQYPAGEQRLLAFSSAADMLSLDQASPGMQSLDGPILQRCTEGRLRDFKSPQRSNRFESTCRPEYVSPMNQLDALKGNQRLDTKAERMRRLNAVATINPFQFSSRIERRAAWQACLADDGRVKNVRLACKNLQSYIQTHLDKFPSVLDSYKEDTADNYEREYIEVMRVIAQQAGKDYADDAHPLAIDKDADAVGPDQVNVAADTPKAHRKRRHKKNLQHDRRFFSYVYRFVCFECSLHFKNENLLKLHKVQHSDSPSEGANSRSCPVCRRSFSKLSSLLRHILDHGVKASQIVHFIPTADPSIMSVASTTAAPMDVLAQSHDAHETCFMYSCGQKSCGLRFCTESMADLHQLSHKVPDSYQGDVVCAGCSYVAANAEDLLKHVGRHGAKTGDHKMCRLCGKFVQDMIEHVQLVHKEAYVKYEARLNLSCDQCEKRFRTSVHLTTHKTFAHTKLPTLECLICAKHFPSPLQLHAHVTQEHGTGLICMVCRKSYTKYSSLSKHARMHKQIHICETCGSVFRSRRNLDTHRYSHRSDYSFKCDQCGKTFKRPSNLAQHKVVVHTDKVRKKRKAKREEMRRKGVVSEYKCPRQRMLYEEFPFKCVECRLGWMLLGNLQQHQRKKHPQSNDTMLSAAASSSL